MTRERQTLYIRYRERKADAPYPRELSGVERTLLVHPPRPISDRNFTEHVLEVDIDELFMHGTDRGELAENRMQHWALEWQRLRPGAPEPSIEWKQLTAEDVEELDRVAGLWLGRHARRASVVGDLDHMIDASLARMLTRIVEKLKPTTEAKR